MPWNMKPTIVLVVKVRISFVVENKKRFETWAFCRDCHHKAPLADFDPDYNDYERQAADERVHEYIIEHRNN